MRNLLCAGIYRLSKNLLFWLALGISIIVGIVFGLSYRSQTIFDDFFVIPIFISFGIFISLSVGREYSSGTFRNKLVAGYKKATIFFSELLLHIIACSLIFVAYFGVFFVLSSTLLPTMPLSDALLIIWGYYLLNIAFAVIFTVVSCLIPSRSIGVVVCMIVFVAMMVGSTQIDFMLAQPENSTIEYMDGYGNVTGTEEVANPNYVDGVERHILEICDNALPYGQLNTYLSYMMLYTYSTNPEAVAVGYGSVLWAYPLYSVGLIVILSGVGLLVFRKRDFK